MSAMSVWEYSVRGAAIPGSGPRCGWECDRHACVPHLGSPVGMRRCRSFMRARIRTRSSAGNTLCTVRRIVQRAIRLNNRDRTAADNSEFPPLSGGRAFRAICSASIHRKTLRRSGNRHRALQPTGRSRGRCGGQLSRRQSIGAAADAVRQPHATATSPRSSLTCARSRRSGTRFRRTTSR